MKLILLALCATAAAVSHSADGKNTFFTAGEMHHCLYDPSGHMVIRVNTASPPEHYQCKMDGDGAYVPGTSTCTCSSHPDLSHQAGGCQELVGPSGQKFTLAGTCQHETCPAFTDKPDMMANQNEINKWQKVRTTPVVTCSNQGGCKTGNRMLLLQKETATVIASRTMCLQAGTYTGSFWSKVKIANGNTVTDINDKLANAAMKVKLVVRKLKYGQQANKGQHTSWINLFAGQSSMGQITSAGAADETGQFTQWKKTDFQFTLNSDASAVQIRFFKQGVNLPMYVDGLSLVRTAA
jgi:hypothetical protein